MILLDVLDLSGKKQAAEKLQAAAQYQLAIHSSCVLGAATQKTLSRFRAAYAAENRGFSLRILIRHF